MNETETSKFICYILYCNNRNGICKNNRLYYQRGTDLILLAVLM